MMKNIMRKNINYITVWPCTPGRFHGYGIEWLQKSRLKFKNKTAPAPPPR